MIVIFCYICLYVPCSYIYKKRSVNIHKFFNCQTYPYVDKNVSKDGYFPGHNIDTRLNPILQKCLQKLSIIEKNYRYKFDVYFGIIEPVHKVMFGKLQTFPLSIFLLVTITLNPNHYVTNLYIIFFS